MVSGIDPSALRAAREKAGLTQHELARLVGAAGGERISRWELGASVPRPDFLVKLARPLTVSLAALVQDDLSGNAPGWMVRLHSTGSWAGPRLLLATFAAYTGRNHLLAEFQEMARVFWDNSLQSD